MLSLHLLQLSWLILSAPQISTRRKVCFARQAYGTQNFKLGPANVDRPIHRSRLVDYRVSGLTSFIRDRLLQTLLITQFHSYRIRFVSRLSHIKYSSAPNTGAQPQWHNDLAKKAIMDPLTLSYLDLDFNQISCNLAFLSKSKDINIILSQFGVVDFIISMLKLPSMMKSEFSCKLIAWSSVLGKPLLLLPEL